ncbi:MAG TPA: bacillithiol system redox-active protein YtxJ [Bacteroidia bacterium]|nr:bacillithiol system redox-active protein YtxJ [Bacteroidia bacterium]
MNWIELTETEQINAINLESINNPDKSFVIFKHSTRCSTSRLALRMFEAQWTNSIPAYLINVVEHRQVSNKTAADYEILHESPQVLVIKNGECIYNASHSYIDAQSVINFL